MNNPRLLHRSAAKPSDYRPASCVARQQWDFDGSHLHPSRHCQHRLSRRRRDQRQRQAAITQQQRDIRYDGVRESHRFTDCRCDHTRTASGLILAKNLTRVERSDWVTPNFCVSIQARLTSEIPRMSRRYSRSFLVGPRISRLDRPTNRAKSSPRDKHQLRSVVQHRHHENAQAPQCR
jgi:hypothetical protein